MNTELLVRRVCVHIWRTRCRHGVFKIFPQSDFIVEKGCNFPAGCASKFADRRLPTLRGVVNLFVRYHATVVP
jgi:hypothetical protein